MVGHPFYLFIDEATGAHSVVYNRRQYAYSIITLDTEATDEATLETRRYRAAAPANA